MKRALFVFILAAAALVFALAARPHSPGTRWVSTVEAYATALEEGRAQDALDLMSPELSESLCAGFLLRLQGEPSPAGLSWNGSDTRGIRISGNMGESGSRVVWLTVAGERPMVAGDTSLDNLLGSAAMICRENAMADPQGSCPVSGLPYCTDPVSGAVVCPSGHLGSGISTGQNRCAARMDSVLSELETYLAAGNELPASLEDMYTLSDGEFGRRGGYSCPDNGYKYYEIRDGAVYCPFHESSSRPAEVE